MSNWDKFHNFVRKAFDVFILVIIILWVIKSGILVYKYFNKPEYTEAPTQCFNIDTKSRTVNR